MKHEVMKLHYMIEKIQEEFNKNRFEILEYWGAMDKAFVEEVGIDIPTDFKSDLDEVQINAWDM